MADVFLLIIGDIPEQITMSADKFFYLGIIHFRLLILSKIAKITLTQKESVR
jgi:hypothetical protein